MDCVPWQKQISDFKKHVKLKQMWECPECDWKSADFKEAERHINDCIAWHDEKRHQNGL